MNMARLYTDEWRRRHVTPHQLKVRHLTMNQLFQVAMRDDDTRKEVSCRHVLVQMADNGGTVRGRRAVSPFLPSSLYFPL